MPTVVGSVEDGLVEGTAIAVNFGTASNSLPSNGWCQSTSFTLDDDAVDYKIEFDVNRSTGTVAGTVDAFLSIRNSLGTPMFVDNASGSAGSFTSTQRQNAVKVAQCNVRVSQTDYVVDYLSTYVARVPGGVAAIIVANTSGGALTASGVAMRLIPLYKSATVKSA